MITEENPSVVRAIILDFYNEYIKDEYKDYLVIMDNAVTHKSKIIRQVIEESGNHLTYSVPYRGIL